MKKQLFLMLALTWSSFSFAASSNAVMDDDWTPRNPAVIDAFEAKYPTARQVSWEKEKGYAVAEFKLRGQEAEACFTLKGVWVQTEIEIQFKALPKAVKQAIRTTPYRNYRPDDVKAIERPDGVYYEVEMEKGDRDVCLFFAENGEELREIPD